MAEPSKTLGSTRFGPFDLSVETGELRKNGVRLKLTGQPIQVLIRLVAKRGSLVTREELQRELWGSDIFGDPTHRLNAAVNRLREALGDSATEPKYIETVPGRGYRFLATLDSPLSPQGQSDDAIETLPRHGYRFITTNGIQPKTATSGLRRWSVPLVAAVLLIALALVWASVGAFVLKRQPTKSGEDLTVVPLTTYPGLEIAPSFSPDGNQIAFSWSHGWGDFTTTDLYVKQIGNERAVRLTKHEARYLVPAWSPDGSNIAFGMNGKDGNGIYLVPSLGGAERRLAEIREVGWPFLLLSWSPDSRWVAFASDSPTERLRIHLVDVATTEQRVLPNPSPDCGHAMEPAFSPDGKYLASDCVFGERVNKIYVQPTAGGGAHEVTLVKGRDGYLGGLAWTADGQFILYSADGSLWRVPAIGGTPKKLPFAHDTETPTVARIGNKVAYAQTNFHRDIWRIELATQTKPAGPASRFISSSLGQEDPSVSPDGKYIAFESSRSGNPEIWRCDSDGSNPVQLTSFGGPFAGSPRWSPDGRRIVFESSAFGRGELYVVNADGGPPHRLMTGTLNAEGPFWSADGRWIYFQVENPDGIWRVSAEGGTALQLTKEDTYNPQESADGKRVFYVALRETVYELWSMSVDGRDQRREEGMPNLPLPYAWTPSQNGIYFLDRFACQCSINYFDLATRHVHKVSELQGPSSAWGIAVSRNSDTLLFSAIDHGESDIMLVEGFR